LNGNWNVPEGRPALANHRRVFEWLYPWAKLTAGLLGLHICILFRMRCTVMWDFFAANVKHHIKCQGRHAWGYRKHHEILAGWGNKANESHNSWLLHLNWSGGVLVVWSFDLFGQRE
jgi:hypothetical protein